MIKDIENIIKNVKTNINKLLAEKEILQKEKEQYKQKLEKANNDMELQAAEIVKLKQQLNALQLLQAELGDADKKYLAKNIDKHIAAINKTITLLSE